jgi:hypothetical protein
LNSNGSDALNLFEINQAAAGTTTNGQENG